MRPTKCTQSLEASDPCKQHSKNSNQVFLKFPYSIWYRSHPERIVFHPQMRAAGISKFQEFSVLGSSSDARYYREPRTKHEDHQ
jgi:hypothetical protein